MATLTTSYQKVAEKYLGNNGYGDVYVRTYAKYNSQSIDNNTSNVSVQCRLYSGAIWYDEQANCSVSFTGKSSGTISCPRYYSNMFAKGEETLYTLTGDVSHNADGTKSITASSTFNAPNWGWSGTASASDLSLPTIPRASSVSSSSPYIGDSATIVISSASSSFTHTLTYSFGSASGTIATKTSATTVAWNTSSLKASLYAQIPNAKSGSGTITCQTYSGNTLVGTKTCGFNLYAKENDCKPSISGSVVDTNSSTIALTGNSAVMVRYMSKPKVTISATANYSSSIKSYSINVDGQTSNSSSATYNTISSNSITISVTDSRGYSSSATLTPSMISYIKLTSNLTITRPEQTSNEAYLNGSGQWFNGTFSSSNANTLSINCQYRKSGDSSWTDLGTLTPSKSGNAFSFSNLKLGDSFDYKEEYQFKITIADRLETIGNQTKDLIILSIGTPIVRIGKEKVFINGKQPFVNVSPTEPTTGEEVWIQKSKNLFNKQEYVQSDKQGIRLKGVLKVGQTYTVSFENPNNTTYGFLTKVVSGDATSSDVFETWTNKPFSFVYTQAMYNNGYMLYILSMTNYYPISYNEIQNLNLQIEQGEVATSYEPYVDKRIHTKNDNDVYDVFYDETNLEIYSTSEQRIGTWIDGKPIYRKVFKFGYLNAGIQEIAHNISNIDGIVNGRGFFRNVNTGSWYPIPRPYPTNMETYCVSVDVNKKNIVLTNGTAYNGTTFYAWIILEYTKNND